MTFQCRGWGKIILMLLLSSPLAMAESIILDIQLIPPSFTVGDSVEARLLLQIDQDMELLPPPNLPKSDWAKISSIRTEMEENTAKVIINFIPFAPGAHTLPPLDLKSLHLEGIKIFTESLLTEGNQGLKGIRPPILLSGTRLVLALLLTLTVAVPPLCFTSFLFLSQWIRKLQRRFLRRKPGRKLKKLLKWLGNDHIDKPSMQWYTLLTEALRYYLEGLTQQDCRSATTAEIAQLPGFEVFDSPRGELLKVLRDGDLVKFAGKEMTEEERRQTLSLVEKATENLRKEEEIAKL